MGGLLGTALLSSFGGNITRSWSRLNRQWKRVLALCLTLVVAIITVTVLYRDAINEIPDRWHPSFLNPEPTSTLSSPAQIFRLEDLNTWAKHPINDLISGANSEYEQLLAKQTVGTDQAAQSYRRRRGRHPPPGFEKWVAFAEAHKSVMIEDHFDRIYHDLNPFWGVTPDKLRADAAALPDHIRIRKGKAQSSSKDRPFMQSYLGLVQKIAPFLPDLDIPINTMDESRVLVPWKAMEENMKKVATSLSKQDLNRPPPVYHYTLDLPDASADPRSAPFQGHPPYWNLARQACPPESEATVAEVDGDFSTPPQFPQTYPNGSYHGYVQNWTLSQDICWHPHLRNLHGTFVEPISLSTSTSLIPMFSGSKLLVNNDILIPAAMYWTDQERFAAIKYHVPWKEKRNEAFWRGTASGGRNKVDNWTRFQRHRLVSMLNGTQVQYTLDSNKLNSSLQSQLDLPHNFPTPNRNLYPLVSDRLNVLPDWIRSFSNVAFTWLECFPATRDYSCPYTGPWYRRGNPVPMHRMFKNKFLPDVDGNSFSGRFRAFLMSNSLPIKASIYTEWHDSRLIPWKHFVPMDNTLMDLWSILEYFFMNDKEGEKIALEGRYWAEKVLRKDDMMVYVYRLLLEYARLVDPNRDIMGWGEDLAKAGAS